MSSWRPSPRCSYDCCLFFFFCPQLNKISMLWRSQGKPSQLDLRIICLCMTSRTKFKTKKAFRQISRDSFLTEGSLKLLESLKITKLDLMIKSTWCSVCGAQAFKEVEFDSFVKFFFLVFSWQTVKNSNALYYCFLDFFLMIVWSHFDNYERQYLMLLDQSFEKGWKKCNDNLKISCSQKKKKFSWQ